MITHPPTLVTFSWRMRLGVVRLSLELTSQRIVSVDLPSALFRLKMSSVYNNAARKIYTHIPLLHQHQFTAEAGHDELQREVRSVKS